MAKLVVSKAEKAIVSELKRQGPTDPTELLTKLEHDFPELAVREAIWRLLEGGEVELSHKRLLSLSQVAA